MMSRISSAGKDPKPRGSSHRRFILDRGGMEIECLRILQSIYHSMQHMTCVPAEALQIKANTSMSGVCNYSGTLLKGHP